MSRSVMAPPCQIDRRNDNEELDNAVEECGHVLQHLDNIPLEEFCNSPSLSGVVVRLRLLIENLQGSVTTSQCLLKYLEIMTNASNLERELKRLVCYVRLVSHLYWTSTSKPSRKSVETEIRQSGNMFADVFDSIYSQIRACEKDGRYDLYLEIIQTVRNKYIWQPKEFTSDNLHHFLRKLTERERLGGKSLLQPMNSNPESIISRVLQDLGSFRGLERMDPNQVEPYFDTILKDVGTRYRTHITEYDFFSRFLKSLEIYQDKVTTILMAGFVYVASWKDFKLFRKLDTSKKRREILHNFEAILCKHIAMAQTNSEESELSCLITVKEIYIRSCLGLHFNHIHPVRPRTTAEERYSSKRKRKNSVDQMKQDPKADLIKAFSNTKLTGHERLVVIKQLVGKFVNCASATGLFKLFFKDSIKLNNDCKNALLWALVEILDKLAIVDFDITHGSDLKRLLKSFESIGSYITWDAFEFLALKSRLSIYFEKEQLSGLNTIVSRIFKNEFRVKEGKEEELAKLSCTDFYPRNDSMLEGLEKSVLETYEKSSRHLESHLNTTSNSDNGKTPDTYQSFNSSVTDLEKELDETLEDEADFSIRNSVLVVDPNCLEETTRECAFPLYEYNINSSFNDISEILEASFDVLDSDDTTAQGKLMNYSATENCGWASCSLTERMLQERLYYFYTKGLCKFKLEGGPISGRIISRRMAGSRSASFISTMEQSSSKRQKTGMNHESRKV